MLLSLQQKLVVSEIPVGLAKLITLSPRKNAKLRITGKISYKRGFYFQVLEGPDEEVDELFSRISEDLRHKSIEVIVNKGITKRFFS